MIWKFALSWFNLTVQFLCLTFWTPYVQVIVLISAGPRCAVNQDLHGWKEVLLLAAHPSHHIKAASALSSSIHIFKFIIKKCSLYNSFALLFLIIVREINRDVFIRGQHRGQTQQGFSSCLQISLLKEKVFVKSKNNTYPSA